MSLMLNSEKIFNFTKPPILLIGSGISQRYLVDFLGWKDLLKAIAERMRIPEKTYIAYVAEAEDDIDGDPPMSCVASKLKKELLK